MSADLPTALGPALAGALETKGYTALTPVQEAVLAPAMSARDLRITSQTGSGKTVAIGIALRDIVSRGEPATGGVARPKALVVAPTRELAKQVEEELSWLYAPLGAKVASVTGGASYRDERRALGAGPALIVGTPGRLLDHLTRGSVVGTAIEAVVLDEADRLLDLGFRDDLEKILAHAPSTRRTHLVSATFPREVRALADSVQSDPAHVEGTPLGAANTDIEHVIHLVSPHDRRDAIVNLLLAHPDEQTLIFARTRAEVGELSASLGEAGFRVTSLSGEMDQNARTRALSAFKRGDLGVLVATDVAARGIDVQDITRVIHAEPPNDADTYTHRSGRTGRAGRKGSSAMLVPPAALARAKGMLSRARITPRVEPVPGPDEIRRATDERVLIDLTRPPAEGEAIPDARVWALAGRIVTTGDPTTAIARLLARARYAGPAEPRAVRSFQPPPDRAGRGFDPRDSRDAREPRDFRDQREQRAPRTLPPSSSFVPFRVTWGAEHGADARRLLALVCRRGNVRGNDIGAIRVARTYSVVEVAETVAAAFEAAALAPDPRDPRVRIHPDTPRSAPSAPPVRFVPAVPPARRSAPVVVEVEHAPAPAPARAHPPAPREYAPPAAPARSGPSRGHFAQAPRTPGPKRSGDGPPRAYGHTGPKRPATNDAPRATAEAPKRGGDEPPRRPRRIVTGR